MRTWSKVIFFSLILFFVFFSDALLSFWAPNLMQQKLGSPALMGAVLGFSSLVGLLADLVLPQIIKGISVKKLLTLAIVLGIVFSSLLLVGLSLSTILIFLVSMAVWGMYYEFLIFGSQQFVAGTVPLVSHAGAWAIIGVFRNLAYFLGPLMAAWLAIKGEWYIGLTAIVLATLALGLNFLGKKTHEIKTEIDLRHINIFGEAKRWKVLFARIWPVIIISLVMGLIDATFWSTGAVFSEKLSRQNFWGGWFLPLYQLPSLFIGFIVAKWGIYKGKKKLSELFLLLSGIVLTFLGLREEIIWLLSLVFISSALLAVFYPLIEGVYSDIVGRMGREKRHLIGFSSAAVSVAYIIGPVLSGFITSRVGERMTFSYLGAFIVAVAIILLLTTPKKLKLPQEEIKTWEK